jgi:hypothetical protein
MTEQDRATLVVSFRRMAAAARRINEVLRNNNYLTDQVPNNWPFAQPAEEFAAECYDVARYYEASEDRK